MVVEIPEVFKQGLQHLESDPVEIAQQIALGGIMAKVIAKLKAHAIGEREFCSDQTAGQREPC